MQGALAISRRIDQIGWFPLHVRFRESKKTHQIQPCLPQRRTVKIQNGGCATTNSLAQSYYHVMTPLPIHLMWTCDWRCVCTFRQLFAQPCIFLNHLRPPFHSFFFHVLQKLIANSMFLFPRVLQRRWWARSTI